MRYESDLKPRRCAKCGSKKIANILYGLVAPTPELLEKIDKGKVVLGGCILGQARWYCKDCDTEIFPKSFFDPGTGEFILL